MEMPTSRGPLPCFSEMPGLSTRRSVTEKARVLVVRSAPTVVCTCPAGSLNRAVGVDAEPTAGKPGAGGLEEPGSGGCAAAGRADAVLVGTVRVGFAGVATRERGAAALPEGGVGLRRTGRGASLGLLTVIAGNCVCAQAGGAMLDVTATRASKDKPCRRTRRNMMNSR